MRTAVIESNGRAGRRAIEHQGPTQHGAPEKRTAHLADERDDVPFIVDERRIAVGHLIHGTLRNSNQR